MRNPAPKALSLALIFTGLLGLKAQAQPTVVSADPLGNPNAVTIVYSTAMNPTSATTLGHYTLTNAAGTAVSITNALLSPDQTTVQLQLGATLVMTTNYILVISGVLDASLLVITPNPTLVSFWFGGNPNGPTFSFDDGLVPVGTRLAVGPDAGGNQINPGQGVTNANGFTNSACLILTQPASGQTFAQWRLTNDYASGATVTNLNLAFKLFMGNGTGGSTPPGLPNGGGNGMLFHWGPGLLEQYTGGASSWGQGLDVTFRSYNSAPNIYGVSIYYGGTAGAGNNTPVTNNPYMGYFNTNGAADDFSEAVDVNLSISNGLLSLTVTPTNGIATNIFSNYPIPGFSPPPMGGNNVAFTATDGSGAHESAWLDNVDLYVNGTHIPASATPVGPVTIVVPPASVTTNETARVTFNVGVAGALPYNYQWWQIVPGVSTNPIPGATGASYRTPLTLYSTMNGNGFFVIVTNNFSSATSSVATLTLIQDTSGVKVASVGSLDGTSIGVLFTSFIDPATAGNPANYLVNGVQPSSADLRTNLFNYGDMGDNYAPAYLKTVKLVPASTVSTPYTVTVTSGVKSLTGLAMTTTNVSGTVLGMSDTDLGTPGTDPLATGSALALGPNQVEVLAGGSDMMAITAGGTADHANWVYQARTGNFDVQAKLFFETLTANGAKAGVMIRPPSFQTDASSPAIAQTVFPALPGRNTYETAHRPFYGDQGRGWSTTGGNGNAAAYWSTTGANWIRIKRVGPTFYGYISPDGIAWTLNGQIALDTNTFPSLEYVGLAVTAANNDGRLCEADFSNWGPFTLASATVSITNDLRSSPPYIGYENTRFTFAVGVTISGLNTSPSDLVYQWQRKGLSDSDFGDILDGTGNASSYTTPLLTISANNGDLYRVIAFAGDITSGHSVTSHVATLSVVQDTNPPTVVSVGADASFLQVNITFDGPMDAVAVGNPAYYTITGPGGTNVPIQSAYAVTDVSGMCTNGYLTLFSPLVPLPNLNPVTFTLCLSTNITDAAGNLFAPNTCTNFSAWVLAYGYLKYERYQGPLYPSGVGAYYSTVEHLFVNPNYPSSPDNIQLITISGFPNGPSFSSPNSGPNANGDSYDFSARITGFFIPPTNGNYQFYVRGNDGNALWVRGDSTLPDPGTTQAKAVDNESFGSGRSWLYSITNLANGAVSGNYCDPTPIAMTGGQPYGLVALNQQGNGGSCIEFTWGPPADLSTPDTAAAAKVWNGDSVTNSLNSSYRTFAGMVGNSYNIKGTNIATYVNPDISRIIASGPTNLSVENGKSGTFIVTATAQVSAGGAVTPVGPVLYQWHSNSVLIAGATNASYTTPVVQYPSPVVTNSVVLSVVGLPFMTITRSATLTTVPDTNPPVVVAASSFGGNTLCLRFDGPLNGLSVTNGTYTLNGAPGVTVTGARLLSDGVTVVLTLSQKLTGSTFSVNVTGVQDTSGNPILAGTTVTGSLVATQLAGAVDIGVGTNNLGLYVVKTNSQPALTNVTFDVNYPGTTVMVTNGLFEIQASGANIGGGLRQDGMQYVYEQRTGDFDIKVRVDGLTVADRYSRAGLMIRENLTPGSRRYSIVADPPNTPAADGTGNGQNSVELDYRSAQDGAAGGWPNNPNPPGLGQGSTATQIPGIYLRLKLVGNNLYAFTSGDAINWVLAGRAVLASSWSKTTCVGMCVTAHTNSIYTAARLSDYGDYTAPTSKQALFLVGNAANVPPGSPNAPQQSSDTRIYSNLIALGFNVTALVNETVRAEDAEGKSVVVWSSTGNSGGTGIPSVFTNIPVPLLTWENGAPRYLNMVPSGQNTTVGSQTSITITNNTGPVASALSMGLSGPVVVCASATMGYVQKSALASGAVIVAQPGGGTTPEQRTVFYAYDKGAAMTTGTAPHRRVGLFLDDGTANVLNDTGLQLITNAIAWASIKNDEAPAIYTQPANQTVPVGSPATFIVTAVGGSGPYTYQWAKITASNTNDIAGATNRDYTILATAGADDGTGYRVTVTGINSGLSVTSSVATLTLQWPVVITGQPQNQTASVGATATFTVTITNNATTPVNYQWYSNNVMIAGANGPSYTTATLTAADDGTQYYVVVNNVVNTVTSATATLAVSSRPRVDFTLTSDGKLVLSWSGGGVLLWATNVTGPWTTNLAATSPYTNTDMTLPRQFFRIQQ